MATVAKSADYISHQDLEVFGNDLHRRIVDDLSEVIGQFSARVDERFNKLEVRVGTLDKASSDFRIRSMRF